MATMTDTTPHDIEVKSGERFEFGQNWSSFLKTLTAERLTQAEKSLSQMLGEDDLTGRSFLDVGSGSGLFSLAARRLGATVHSLDYDPNSVGCTEALRETYFPGDREWTVETASALDHDHMSSLGQFDFVYSWGVLHHTGDMWKAIANVSKNVGPGGALYIAIYNDQGGASLRWTKIKRLYNRLPAQLRTLYAVLVYLPLELRSLSIHTLRGNPGSYFSYIRHYATESERGMSWWHDKIDWIGGYPFEVSKPEEVLDFLKPRGFDLEKLKTCGGSLGCNEFLLRRGSDIG